MTNKKPEYPVSGLQKKNMQSHLSGNTNSRNPLSGNSIQKSNQQKIQRNVYEVSSDDLEDRVRFHRFGM
jgi:hypothetical protein